MVAMAVVAALAAAPEKGKPSRRFGMQKIPSDEWRFYDGMLYMLA